MIEDRDLIKDIKRNKCSECITTLKERHIGLINMIYGRYSIILQSLSFNLEDFKQEIDFIIYDSARKFDLRRKNIKFSSWLAEQTRFFCLNKINEIKKLKTISSEPNDITRIMDECNKNLDSDLINRQEICNYIFSILEQIKDKRIIKIFNMRHFEGNKNKMTWKEISKNVTPTMTSQGIINLYAKGLKMIKQKLRSSDLIDKI